MTHGEFTLKFSKMLTEYEKEIRAEERTKTIDEIIALYKEMQPNLATNVLEFGDRLEQMKGGAE